MVHRNRAFDKKEQPQGMNITLTPEEIAELDAVHARSHGLSGYAGLIATLHRLVDRSTGTLEMPWEVQRQLRDYAQIRHHYRPLQTIFGRTLGPRCDGVPGQCENSVSVPTCQT